MMEQDALGGGAQAGMSPRTAEDWRGSVPGVPESPLALAIGGAAAEVERLETQVARLGERLTSVLPHGYFEQPKVSGMDDPMPPAGSQRADEVVSLAARVSAAANKLGALADSVQV